METRADDTFGALGRRLSVQLALFLGLCLWQVGQRLLHPCLSLSCGALPRPRSRRVTPGSGCTRSCVSHSTCARAFSRHASNPSLPRHERMPPRRSLAPASRLVSHSLQTDRPCGHQRTYDLGQRVVEGVVERYSKVRQHVIVDRYMVPHPTVGIVLVARTRQPSGAP